MPSNHAILPPSRHVLVGTVALALATACLALQASGTARAAPPEARLTAARELFVSAEHDEDHQLWSQALAKLREVAAVKLTAGVRYHVALCEEHLGQLAVALSDFSDAEGLARSENAADVIQLVSARIADLNERVPRLVLHVTPEIADSIVKIDGDPIPPQRVGVALTLDPGNHRVETSAPGRVPTMTIVPLHERDWKALDVSLGALTDPPPAAPAEGPAAPSVSASPSDGAPPSRESRVVAIAATAGAAILTGVGIGAYLAGDTAHQDSVRICATFASTDPSACDPQKNLVRRWDWFAATAWAGALTSATVAVLSWTKRGPTRSSARVVVGPCAVGIAGRF